MFSHSIMVKSEDKKFKELRDAIDKRFPNPKFYISCFKTIPEIENKVLTKKHKMILYTDLYENSSLDPKTRQWKKDGSWRDYFLVKRRRGADAIYYKDVIDAMIKNKFKRDDCDHRFMEDIGPSEEIPRNKKSIPTYASFWGS